MRVALVPRMLSTRIAPFPCGTKLMYNCTVMMNPGPSAPFTGASYTAN